jgi:predicted ArsR family transcriptional regulator
MSAPRQPSYPPLVRSTPPPSSTKGRLLALLKRHGGQTVDELATALSLASMTVRQHLATLERDELIRAHEVRRGRGRPRYVYRLTEQGEESFPKRYDRLAVALLQELTELDGAELLGKTAAQKQDVLLGRLAAREADRLAPRLNGKALPERVAVVTELLDADGGLAEWERTARGFEIRDYNCVYRRVVQQQPAVCSWHINLLSRLLGAPVTHGEQPLSRGGPCCRFIVGDGAPERDSAAG